MSEGMRLRDQFKQDAVVPVVERGFAVSEVAEWLGISTRFPSGRKQSFVQALRNCAMSALPSFALRNCCAMHERQQCESCIAALAGVVHGSSGPSLSEH